MGKPETKPAMDATSAPHATSQPLVSILIPVHNAAGFIRETLRSALNQTWSNIEVIVVDDGSTDDSAEIVERMGHPRVQLHRQEQAGAASARNRAFACSGGDYIQFLDADDLLAPEKIELQLARLRENPNAVATSEWGRFFNDPEDTQYVRDSISRDLSSLDWIAANWDAGSPMHCVHSFLIPRAVCEEAGPWNKALIQNEDGEYFTRVVSTASRVLHCAGARAMYRSGLARSLSRLVQPAHLESRFLALHLCERRILTVENTERMRRGLSLAWQHFAYYCHPYDKGLAEQALARARVLHDVTVRPVAGAVFNLTTALVGWRAARKLQVLSGRS